MDTFLNILNTANLWAYTTLAMVIFLWFCYYWYSSNKVHKKYISKFCNLSSKTLVEKLKKMDDKGERLIILQEFSAEVINIRHAEWLYPYITYQCRKLLKEHVGIKNLWIDNITSESSKPNRQQFSQKDIVFALQTAYECKEYSTGISRTNAHHLSEIFGGKSNSYRKHCSAKLRSEYVGQDKKITKLLNVIDHIQKLNPDLSFDKTRSELDKLRTAQK